MREAFAAQLAELERRIEEELERASVIVADIADAIQTPSADKAQQIAEQATRLRHAGRTIDTELVIVTARQTPVASDLRLVLALIEVAAARIAADLKAAGVRGSVIDLANRRHDGYDLTDWLSSRPELHGAELRRALGAPSTRARSHAAQGIRR